MTEIDAARPRRAAMAPAWARSAYPIVLIAMLAALLLAGCGSSESTGGAATDSGGDDDKGGDIVIGEAIGVSGWLEAYDGPAAEGAKLAVEEINAAGGVDGRQLKLVTSDHQSDANLGLRAAQDVIDRGADILITSCNYENAAPAARLANQKQMVVFSYCAGEPQFSRQTEGGANSFTFDLGNATNGVGASMAAFAHEQGWRSAYVLKDTFSNYTRMMADFFSERFKGYGDTTIAGTDTFKNDDASIAGQIAKLKQSDADVLVIGTTLPGGATAVRQIRAAGVDIPILTGDGMDSASVTDAVPKLSDFYQTVAASTFGDDPSPDVNDFFAKIEERTGKPADGSYAIFGYSIIQALKTAIEDAGTTDGPELKAALESFDGTELLIGPVTFSPEAHLDATRPEKVLEMNGGKASYHSTVQPTEVPDPF